MSYFSKIKKLQKSKTFVTQKKLVLFIGFVVLIMTGCSSWFPQKIGFEKYAKHANGVNSFKL